MESKRTIYVSIACDFAIAGTKFLAAGLTGSSAMLSEGIHSVVDSCNGILLLWGRHASARPPDADHPFGYGKELYFWSLIVAVLIFSIGGGMSIYEGFGDLRHGGPIERATWNYVVLGFAAIFEIATVIVAAKDFRRERGRRGWWVGVHTSKDPTVFTVLLDNGAAVVGLIIAFLGVFFEHVFNLAYLDGIASILIGLTLAGVAVVLAAESKGLLVGEGVDKQTLEHIRRLAESDSAVVRVGGPLTMYFGPHTVLLALDVQFHKGLSATEVTAAVDRMEKSIRAEYPVIQRIFIEAESLTPTPGRPAPLSTREQLP